MKAIRVRFPDMKRAQLLASDGCLTNRRLHAAMLEPDKAEQVAAEIREEHPDAVVMVGTL